MAITADVKSAATYDTELRTNMVNATTNAELTVVLRVFLQQVTVASAGATYNDFDGTSFNIRDWDGHGAHSNGYHGEYADFTHRYQAQGQAFWNGKFWLTTPNTYRDLDWPSPTPTHRPNVYCKFHLELVNGGGSPHKTIQLVRLDRATGTSTTFRSDDSHYDNFDLATATYRGITDVSGHDHTYYQKTFIHEIGHALGLAHIGVLLGNAVATANPNAPAAYGFGTLSQGDAANIMGYGMTMSTVDAAPWIDRIAQHTGTNKADWTAVMKDNKGRWPTPRLLKSIPGAVPGP